MSQEKPTQRPGESGRKRAAEIRQFVLGRLNSIEDQEIGVTTAKEFGVGRHLVHKQMRRLEESGEVVGVGSTKARRYRLSSKTSEVIFPIDGLEEHVAWAQFAEPLLTDLPQNIIDICTYGFMEMVNNAIDHSEARRVSIDITRAPDRIQIRVFDGGIGVFRKIQVAFQLPSLQEAIFELNKGKLTTDPTRHTGEGIFYTSRMFDQFFLWSQGLSLQHRRAENDWLIGHDHGQEIGTLVTMTIDPRSTHTSAEVFDAYSTPDKAEMDFGKTNVVLKLLDFGDDSFVSRSQAKRVLTRLPRFKEVLLDFKGVDTIAPAFADEIFRVFKLQHPEVNVTPIHASEPVREMINRARARIAEDAIQPTQPADAGEREPDR